MNPQPETLSDRLKVARNRLTDHRHGGVVLTGDDLEATITGFNEFIRLAKQLETELDRADWNRKANVDLRLLINGQGAVVLDAMRSGDGKVVLLRPPG